MDQFIESFAQKLLDHKIADQENPLIPCTDFEIDSLEAEVGVKFPRYYRDYLELMGRQSGHFLEDEKHTYSELLTMQDCADELMAKAGADYKLSATEFVFCMTKCSQFLFIDTVDGEDPPVYCFRKEAGGMPAKKFDHFSDALRTMLLDELASRGTKARGATAHSG